MIGGFIITGNASKKVIIRALGLSLQQRGVTGALADPVLELHGPNGSLITSNDNWKDTQRPEIEATTIAPENDFESAIVAALAPGGYTAVASGKNGGSGIALVEVYDLNQAADAKLANISTRGFVELDQNVMIAGFILGPSGTAGSKIIVRGLGQSLIEKGVNNAVVNPRLELRNSDGSLLGSNDNWKDTQRAEIEATGIPPTHDLEAAIVTALPSGTFTVILDGYGNTGVGVVEVYNLQ
jgi:hypothetical protein